MVSSDSDSGLNLESTRQTGSHLAKLPRRDPNRIRLSVERLADIEQADVERLKRFSSSGSRILFVAETVPAGVSGWGPSRTAESHSPDFSRRTAGSCFAATEHLLLQARLLHVKQHQVSLFRRAPVHVTVELLQAASISRSNPPRSTLHSIATLCSPSIRGQTTSRSVRPRPRPYLRPSRPFPLTTRCRNP